MPPTTQYLDWPFDAAGAGAGAGACGVEVVCAPATRAAIRIN